MSDRSTVLLEHHLKELKAGPARPTWPSVWGSLKWQCRGEGLNKMVGRRKGGGRLGVPYRNVRRLGKTVAEATVTIDATNAEERR